MEQAEDRIWAITRGEMYSADLQGKELESAYKKSTDNNDFGLSSG